MQDMWQGEPLADFMSEALILLGVMVMGVVVAAKNFRWE